MRKNRSGRRTMRLVAAGLVCLGLLAPGSAGAIGAVSFKLSGYVKDAAGVALSGVSVSSSYTTCDIASECVNMSATTASNGYYQFTLASTGTVGLTITRSDLVTQTQSRTISTPQDTRVDFTALYRLTGSLSAMYHSVGSSASTATVSLSSYAPDAGTGSCVVVTDSRTGQTTAATLASPGAASSWTWTLTVPQGTPDGTHTLTAKAQACGGGQQTLSQLKTFTYVVDSTAPEILNLTPMDGQNTIFTSQPLQAEVVDPTAGINASGITFTMTDRTSGAVTTYGATYSAATGIATSSPAATLVPGHDYTVRIAVTDRAGNVVEDGHRSWKHAASGDNGGFRAITLSATQATGAISVVCPVTGDPLNRVATCSSVPLSMSSASVTVPESRHSYDTAYVLHTFSLASAEIKAGVQSTNAYARRIASGSEWDPRTVAYSYRVGDRLELPATFVASPPSSTLGLGTLKVSVPSEWTGVSSVTLTLQASSSNTSGGIVATSACATPLSSAVPCTTDPLWSRFVVHLADNLSDRAALMARHRGWGADVRYEWDHAEVVPSYEAILLPDARAAIKSDVGVVGVYPVRSKNLEDRYVPLVAEIPGDPIVGLDSVRWQHSNGVEQKIALAPSGGVALTHEVPFLGSFDEPAPPETAEAPDRTVTITPIDGTLQDETAVRATARGRARYESIAAPYWIEAMPVRDEGIRLVVQLRDASAPATYDFALALPAGTTLVQGENGSAAVVTNPDGAADIPLGVFEPPFAYDADGRTVPVTQTVTPTSIRLTLALTGTETFPVLADPTYTAVSCSQATTYGSSADFLKDNRRCPYGVTFVWAKGYWPKKARVAGESTSYRHVRESGECSTPIVSIDNLWYYDFAVPCRMHDYGYDLIRVKEPWDYQGVNKNDADYEFLDAMNEHCADRSIFYRWSCHKMATRYYLAVVAFGRPDRHTAPSGSWPSTSFLRNSDFTSGLTHWSKVGSGSVYAERDANTGWYHAEINCSSAGCGVEQTAPVPNNLRGGEWMRAGGQVHCDHTSGECRYTVRMDYKRVSDGQWEYADSCSGTIPTHNAWGWYYLCSPQDSVPLNQQYSHVRFRITTNDVNRKLDLRFPYVEMQ